MAVDSRRVKFEIPAMNIGIPKEIKPQEGRVAMTPSDCAKLVQLGHAVYLESSAGDQSGYTDADYRCMGVQISPDADALYQSSRLIVKVKEPIEADLSRLRSDHILFCFLHLAANAALIQQLRKIGLTAVAFETIEVAGGLPILKPMSEVAGRVAVQVGTHLLHQPAGGKGILLGGVSGTDAGHVTVLGAGVAGSQAALLASAMGGDVWVFDRSEMALSRLQSIDHRIQCHVMDSGALAQRLTVTDLLVGAVLVKGAKAPSVVTREMVRGMPTGSVLADISVDQGGCIETTRPTSYDAPTYIDEGVIHFCVSNMPGAVPRTSTQAISAVLPKFVHRLTDADWLQQDEVLRAAVNVHAGEIWLDSLKDIC